ncbi:MAG: hypothetical protein ABI200_00295 [Gaiellales bacterium]
MPAAALGHVQDTTEYRSYVTSVEPDGLPIEVTIVDGDQVRFENFGNETIEICGYEIEDCEPWVRIGADGVFEDRNSKPFYVNQEADTFGAVPEGAADGTNDWVRVRRKPLFYKYHDHRVHWMAKDTLPPNVDPTSSATQHVFDGEIKFRYGTTEGVVKARLDYIGGRSWWQRYGEYSIMMIAVLAMITVFWADARRRRLRREAAVEAAAVEDLIEAGSEPASGSVNGSDAEPDAVGAGSAADQKP